MQPSANQPKPRRSLGARPRRLRTLVALTGATRYLEVGVASGETFFAIDALEKIAVDPAFRFDPAERAAPGVSFHPVTSDAYFADLDPDARFDVVYLDGLHTFEQTYRDLCNTLLHIHPGSAILIDDTVPTSALSARRDPQGVIDARALDPSFPKAWHGDVFKVVLAIHDLHPGLNYATFAKHGQTLVWRSTSFRRAPHFARIGEIDALDFADFASLRPLMRIATEVEVYEGMRTDPNWRRSPAVTPDAAPAAHRTGKRNRPKGRKASPPAP